MTPIKREYTNTTSVTIRNEVTDKSCFQVIFHHENIFDIQHWANDEKGQNWCQAETWEKGRSYKGIRFTTKRQKKG